MRRAVVQEFVLRKLGSPKKTAPHREMRGFKLLASELGQTANLRRMKPDAPRIAVPRSIRLEGSGAGAAGESRVSGDGFRGPENVFGWKLYRLESGVAMRSDQPPLKVMLLPLPFELLWGGRSPTTENVPSSGVGAKLVVPVLSWSTVSDVSVKVKFVVAVSWSVDDVTDS
jgi:hypothetical protein